MSKFKNVLLLIFRWIWNKFKIRYQITVSFNKEYGDSDDRTFVTKKILVQKEKHLKFRDENDYIIEYRSAGGLNYIIEEI